MGLDDSCIAQTPAEYLAIAADLAENVNDLHDLRTSLRDRMTNSPLCDGVAFTRKLEQAYRKMMKAAD